MLRFYKKLRIVSSFTLALFCFQSFGISPEAEAHPSCWNDGKLTRVNGGAEGYSGDGTPPGSEEIADPVNISNGSYNYKRADFYIPSKGTGLEITRTYNNRSEYDGPFGIGWTHTYNIYLAEFSDGVENYVLLSELNYKKMRFKKKTDGSYERPKGYYDTLTKKSGGYELCRKHGTILKFNLDGLLISITDRNNNKITLEYNSSTGFLETVTDAVARKITITYGANKKIKDVTDFAGRKFSYGYDAGLNLTSVKYPATGQYPQGTTITYAYDGHNLTGITDQEGQTYLSQDYDSNNRVIEQTYGEGTFYFNYDTENNITTVKDRRGSNTAYYLNPDGTINKKISAGNLITLYEYNLDKEIIKITHPRGNSTEYDYDQMGNLLKVVRKHLPGSTVSELATTFAYEDSYNFIKTATDPEGNTTIYTYDYEIPNYGTACGNLVKINYPVINNVILEASFTYTEHGQLETTTDSNGIKTKYEYNSCGYLTKIIKDYGNSDITSEFGHDAVGNMIFMKDAKGNSSTFQYDALNQLTKSFTPAPFNYETKYFYDKNGNLTKVQRQANGNKAEWQTTVYEYNILDKITSIADNLGNKTSFVYDENENRISVIDARNNVTLYEYNQNNLLVKTTDALGNRTGYSYDENDNLKNITDAKDNTTTYEYDDFDRLASTTYADGSVETYRYDAVGNLTEKADRKGQKIAYNYDALNKLIEKKYPDDSTVNYEYDAASRLTKVTDATGEISYSYDNLNRVRETTQYSDYTIQYEYDAVGNRTKLVYPNSSYITYAYDELNRLTDVKNDSAQSLAHYNYDALSRRTDLELLNFKSASYTYDSINRLTSMNNGLWSINYTYDDVGNRTSMTTPEGVHDYTYDKIYQLTYGNYPDSSNITYNYDALGNRESTQSDETIDYTSNNLNQYTNVGGTSYAYDGNGSLTNDGINTYNYDYENRLAEAVTSDDTITYTYDPFGRRISSSLRGAEGDEAISYVYDGDQVIAEYDKDGSLKAKYTYGPDIDEPITMERGGETYYYHFDALGSVTALTDSSGSLKEKYTYDIFGKPTILDPNDTPLTESAINNPYMFTGRRWDEETGLYYYRARMYAPAIGRFLQTDPISYYDNINLYSYVNNNPLNYIDPLGWCKEKDKKWWEELQIYLTMVGSEMEKGYMTNMQGLIGTIGVNTSAYSNIGSIPRAIGYSNKHFLQGGRMTYRWANQYGSGIKIYSWGQMGAFGSVLAITSAAMTGWTIGETINAYYWGYQNYKKSITNK